MEGTMNIKDKLTPEEYNTLLHTSVTNLGDIHKMQQKLNQSHINVVFLGASVTFGYSSLGMLSSNYTSMIIQWLNDWRKDNEYCHGISLAECGTSCTYAMFLVETLLLNAHPDVIFVEYAINEQNTAEGANYFESLIRKLQQLDSDPLIIVINVFNQICYSCDEYMTMIAKHYNLPVLSLTSSLLLLMLDHKIDWSDYSCDESHPYLEGHELIKDIFKHYVLDHIMDQEPQAPQLLPTNPCFAADYEQLKLLDFSDKQLYITSFELKLNKMLCFSNYLTNVSDVEDHEFTVTLFCKSVFLLFYQDNDLNYACAQVIVDGKRNAILNGYSIFGWGNPYIVKVLDESESKNHIVKIKLDSGEKKKKFILLRIGYC